MGRHICGMGERVFARIDLPRTVAARRRFDRKPLERHPQETYVWHGMVPIG